MYTFNCGPLYYINLNATEDCLINQGGTDSGKTFSIMQVLCTIATTTEPPSVDPIITILSQSVPDAKKGPWRLIKTFMMDDNFRAYIKSVNETDRFIYFTTGWVMEFVSAIDEQTAKQGKRQYLFANEANGIPWAIFWQMAKRTRVRIWIDYNPSEPFWAHDKLIGSTKTGNDLSVSVRLIISDHRHNPFLSNKDHFRTENIKDDDLWKVYARGMTGNLQGIIYPKWRMIELNDWPKDVEFFGAIDFGYTNDPTAAVKMCRIGDKIFVHEICYEPGISPTQLVTLFKAEGFTSQKIYAEHDPDMISQLRRLKMQVYMARKGAGSIRAGILKVKEYDVFYTSSSKNIDFERKRYMFQKDVSTGKLLNEPTEGNDHLMDAIRYGIYTHYFRAQ